MIGATGRRVASRPLGFHTWAQIGGIAPDLTVVGVTVAFAVAISRAPLGSGDYGQWLMVSRLYAGHEVPEYRELGGIAPLVPLLLALLRVFVEDPVVALNALRIVLLTWVVTAFYLAGTTLFRSRSAGLLSAILPVLLTQHFLEMFAFGGLLQAASIVFLLLAMAALALAMRGGREERGWWTAAALCGGLAMLSHAGSVVVIVPSIGAASLVVLLRRGGRDWREWPARLAPAAFVAAGPSLYWLLVLAPANSSYATNPASLAYRGPERLFGPFLEPSLTLLLVTAGAAALGAGLARCLRRRRTDAYALVAAWAAATWGVTVATAAMGAATDYPRFSPLLLAPLTVAAAGGLAELGALLDGRFRSVHLPVNASIAVAAALLLLLGPRQIDTFHGRSLGYALNDQDGLRTAASWLDDNLPEGQTVLTSTNREGKWIEGLTGKEALFAGPIRYSFRSAEWERTLDATALIRSTSAVANGAWLGMFTTNADAGRELVPAELLLAMNHDGEFQDVIRLPDTEAYVTSEGRVLARLSNLQPLDVERIEDGKRVAVRTTWAGVRGGVSLTWVREVSMDDGSHVVVVSDKVLAPGVPLGEIVVHVRPASEHRLRSIVKDEAGPLLRFIETGRRSPLLRITSPSGARLEPSGAEVVAAGGTEMTLQFEALTAGAPVGKTGILYPPQILEDYGVGAAVVDTGPAMDERVERLRALGFNRELHAGEYVILIRETAVGRVASATHAPEAPQ